MEVELVTGTRRTFGARTGGRSERVVREVMRATIHELARVGYGRMRVDAVALRASVNKTTVYRRWPTKADLALAAVRTLARFDRPPPDVGTVREDLMELVRMLVALLRTTEGRAIARVMTVESEEDRDVERVSNELRREAQTRRESVIARAKQRGELRPDIEDALLVEAIFSPILARALHDGHALDEQAVAKLVDLVVTGAEHGGGRGRVARANATMGSARRSAHSN